MATLARSDAVINLGKRLAAELEDTGLVGAWMAHHIAGLMLSADMAAPADQEAAYAACRAAIFELWDHRASWPSYRRPLRDLDPVLHALASLDGEKTRFRYHPAALQAASEANVPEAVGSWIKLATGLDYTARLLIRFALSAAVANCLEDGASWIEIAREAGAEEGAEGVVVRFLLENEDPAEAPSKPNELADRLKRLRAFIDVASTMAGDIEAQLSSPLPPSAGT